MAEQGLKNKTVKGLVWSGAERFSVQGVQFMVMLVIARILDPKDFGLIGMLAIFIAITQSLIDSGFSQALIRKQDRTEVDNCTVFYFNIVASVALYFLLFLTAPLVAEFYKEPQLAGLMRVLCLVVIINSFAVVQRAIYTAVIDFKTQAKASLTAAIISGGLGIWLAKTEHGVWTLVWQQLLKALINVILLWWYSTWRPHLVYSWKSFRELFAFGSKLMISGLIDTTYNNIYTLVIGKVFSASSLGHYTQAQHFTQLPSSNITGILQRVTYPVLCSIQDDDERLQTDYRMLLRLSAFIIFPMMCLLAGISFPLVELVLGEKWLFAGALIIPLSFRGMWYPIHAINLNLLQVKGRSDLFLKLEIIKKVIGVSILVVSIPFGLMFMCYSSIATSVICLFVNTYYTGKLINVGFFSQMRDLSGIFLLSVTVFAIVNIICSMVEGCVMAVLLGCVVGIIFFIIIAVLFSFKEVYFLKNILNNK